MKHIKIFEEFMNTQQEGYDALKRYGDDLTSAAESVIVNGQEVKPIIKITGNPNDLKDLNRSMSIRLILDNDEIVFDIIDGNNTRMKIHKPGGLKIETNSLHNIIGFFKRAKPYLGGLNDSNLDDIRKIILDNCMDVDGYVSKNITI